MNLKSFTKLAAVSAVALGAAMFSAGVIAAPIQIGDPMDVNINAEVENSIDVVITDIDLGAVGSMNDTVDVATLVLSPFADTVTEDPGNGFGNTDPASLVNDPADPATRGNIVVTGAFQNTDLYATYANCTDVASGTAVGPNNFILLSIADNMGDVSLALGTPVQNGTFDCVTLAMTEGQATTDAAGAMTIHLGMTLQTDPAEPAGAYGDAADYQGDFDMYLSY